MRGGESDEMSELPPTQYADVPSRELPDGLWVRIEPLLPKVRSRYRGRGKQRKHIGGQPPIGGR
jgi:hypothetical protein